MGVLDLGGCQGCLGAHRTKAPQPLEVDRPAQGFGGRRALAMADCAVILSERAEVTLGTAALAPVLGVAEPGAGEPAFPGAYGDG